jgi:hypothetical protein
MIPVLLVTLVVLGLPNLCFAFQFKENRKPRERGSSGK